MHYSIKALCARRLTRRRIPFARQTRAIKKTNSYNPSVVTVLSFVAVLCCLSSNAQQVVSPVAFQALPDAPGPSLKLEPSPAAAAGTGEISGTVLNPNGAIIEDAHVVLTNNAGTIERIVQSGPNGQFSFVGLPNGTYKLRVTAKGMGTYVSPQISLHADEMYIATQVVLPVETIATNVTVYGDKEELAEEQVHIAVEQRVWGVFPNFYSTYDWNAPPLGTKQKYKLALRAEIDPVTFLGIAGIAGAEQYENIFPGYGGGFQGYAKRYGAAYANSFSGRVLSGAVYASLFHQDPRYFYKGTGSTRSRALYAISAAVITRDDNGHWKPNYSHVLGNFTAGALSNLYYPSSSRGVGLVVSTGLIETVANAGNNLLREFVLKGITSHVPKGMNGRP